MVTCPEVTPYNRTKTITYLQNSLKAEHYLKSGLNRLPTSVAPIQECVAHAFNPSLSEGPRPVLDGKKAKPLASNKTHQTGSVTLWKWPS